MQSDNRYSRFYIFSIILFFISLWMFTDTQLALASDDATSDDLSKLELELKKVQLQNEKINLLLTAGYEGKVDVDEGAGRADGMLLGALAVNTIAARFAESIKASLVPLKEKNLDALVLFSTENVPKFQSVDVFNAQYGYFREWYGRLSKPSLPEKFSFEGAVATGAALLRYAKTDYAFYDIKINSDNQMLISSVSSKLRILYPFSDEHGIFNKIEILAPEIYYVPDAKDVENINQKIKDLKEWNEKAKKKKEKEWKEFSKSLDVWLKSLFAGDSKKLSEVIFWSSMRERLSNANSYIIVVELYEIAGTAYTKKNLWSTLGANPFKVMGAAMASYTMYEAKSGKVVSSMLLPVHGGYYSISELREYVEEQAKAGW